MSFQTTSAIFSITLLLPSLATQAAEPSPQAAAFFEAKIRPLLVRRCLRCHGGEKTQRGLRVDSRQALLRGGKSGSAIVPKRADSSLLIKAIRYGEDGLQMPPNRKLPKSEIALLEKWVNMGAPWPKRASTRAAAKSHWSFQPIGKVKPPREPSGWAVNPIDAFVAAKLRQQGIQLGKTANPRVLIRRLYHDLVGLPPPWKEVEAFVADHSTKAWRKLVNRLLASRQYGERWGRHWLDLVRYSDTQGGSVDCPIPQARLYRDYVIDSFQADKPYDEFVREQIAGDLMVKGASPKQFRERIVATGFVGLSLRNGIFKHYHPELIIEDTIDTIGRSMLGLSIRCARCHDHKFEPISTADYYRMHGIFASSRYPFSGSELPKFSAGESVPLIASVEWSRLPAKQRDAIQQLRAKIKATRDAHPAQNLLKVRSARLSGDRKRYITLRRQGHTNEQLRTSIDDQDIRILEVVSTLDSSVRNLWNRLKAMERSAGIIRAYAMREESPVDSNVQIYGDPFDVGQRVKRGVPERLAHGGQIKIPPGQSGRLQLAQWLTRRDNPLTPRVAVNYIWQFHFGKGIVNPPDNFGVSGTAPTHPQLLDWLAGEFINNRWSIKHIHRLILMSKTYRLANSSNAQALVKDPTNQWHWRFDRRRLDAESIRDGIMQVAGTLNLKRPGVHPFPPESTWQFSQHGPFKAVYDSPHRSVYLMTQRIQRHPFFALFDGPDTSRSTTRRKSSAAALQALYLRNSPFIHRQSEALAKRLLLTPSRRQRIKLAVRRAWSRDPSPSEVDEALAYTSRYAQQLKLHDLKRDRSQRSELVLEYRFEGNARDTSGRNRHGKVLGNPKYVKGHTGKCISLDGDGDYVDSLSTMNDLGKSFTVECWVKPGPSQAHYADIFGNHLGGGRGFVLQQFGAATNQFRGSFGVGNNNWVLGEPVQLATGKWQRIALVRTPRAMQIYLNGKRRSEVLSTALVEPSPLSLRVGLGISLVGRSFFGEIDEFRVFKGIPKKYQDATATPQIELSAWASYCRILLSANEFLYVD